MSMENKQAQDAASVMESFMLQASQAWQNLSMSANGIEAGKESPSADENKDKKEEWSTERLHLVSQENWRSLFESIASPEPQAPSFMGLGSNPDFIAHLADNSWQIFAGLQKLWTDQLQKTGEFSTTNDFSRIDREAFRQWSNFYDQEFRKFFNVPQLGLNKYHQEKINRMIDNYNCMQMAITEFYNIMFTPLRESAIQMQKQISQWTDEGSLPDDPKIFYRHWIKILEGRYMELFKSEDYIKGLRKALYSNLEYHKARREALENLFRSLFLPTEQDLDGVYKELYNLKKQVKSLEQQLNESTRNIGSVAVTG